MKRLNETLRRVNPAGLVVSSGGMSGGSALEGPAEVVFAGLIGGLGGFVCGMLIGSLARVFTLGAKNGVRGGIHWAAYGAGVGAMTLAIIELFD